MPRISPIDPATASPKAAPLLETVQAKLGVTPNMMLTMAQSPAALKGYLEFSDALAHGTLGGRLSEQIALDIAEDNGCGYCLSAHAYLAANVAKLTDEQIAAARNAESDDPKTRAALQFARQINEQRGHPTDEQVQAVRDAGYDDASITEIVAHVALNVLTNYLNETAAVEIDFPVVEPGVAAA